MQFNRQDLNVLEKALIIAIKCFDVYCDKTSNIEFQEILSRIQEGDEYDDN